VHYVKPIFRYICQITKYFLFKLFTNKEMKRTILLALGALTFASAGAQQAIPTGKPVKVPAKIANKAYTISHNNFVQTEMYALPAKSGNPTVGANQVSSFDEVVIGKSVYDLQTNSSVQNRVVNHGGGQVSAVWTFGKVDASFPERGTGYNYRNGTSWIQTGYDDIDNIVRVENIRTGFPSLSRVAGKGDVVVAHDLDGSAQLAQNNNVGDLNTWTNAATPMDSTFWNRMIVGGPDGKTIHVIALTTPTTGTPAGVPYQGIDGALVYSRSTNGGSTWDKQKVLLPGIDATLFKRFGGDAYAIDAKGNTVAFVVGGFNNDMFLMKSTDNGDNWTKTRIMDFPIDAYDDNLTDINNDGLVDTVETNDGALAIVIDNSDLVHVFTGAMRMLNDDTTDGTYSYFPGTAGLLYWNENLGPDNIATALDGVPDRNGNGTLDIGADIPVYQVGLISHPSAGIDASGRIYVTFDCIADNTLLDTRSYRHIFAMTTADNGATFTDPVEITFFDEFTEYVYGAIGKNVDDKVHLVYQRDGEPGIAVSPADANPHIYAENDIVYLDIASDFYVTSVTENININNVTVYPNPASEFAQLTFTLADAANISASLVNVMGQKVAAINGGNFAPGTHTVNLDINGLAAGVYFVNLNTGNGMVTEKLIVR
jgi:hypothetical protein